MAGVSWVGVAPTHRRRGVLTGMFAELHSRMGAYPIAGLEASARRGSTAGSATARRRSWREPGRRPARGPRSTPSVPDPGGVRVVAAGEHRDQLEEIYERWRLQTPGGLHTPRRLWDEVLGDREVVARRRQCVVLCCCTRTASRSTACTAGEQGQSVEITKLAAVTPQAYIALWRVLLGMDLMEKVTIETPPGPVAAVSADQSPAGARAPDAEDGLWLRMLDIPAVLRGAHLLARMLSVVLEVSDGILGGGGRFALEVRDGRARCVPTDAAADVQLDLSVLGSLYFGDPPRVGIRRGKSPAVQRLLRSSAQLDAAFATDVPAELGFGF